ncbi:MAG: DOMON domain-containing protein [Alkalispirochaeta sp.]
MIHPRRRMMALFLAAYVTVGGVHGVQAQSPSAVERTVAGVDVRIGVVGDTLEVELSAETTGWISIGFDPSRQMADANIIIAYVEDGELRIADDYGIGRMAHGRDTEHGGSDDIIAATGRQEDGVTTVEFTIPLDSGDDLDKPLIPGETYLVLVAYGPDGAADFTTYHANRGSFELEL